MRKCLSSKSIRTGEFAEVDIDRFRRRGFPEVIYCPGKTKEQIRKIAAVLLKEKQPLLLTRLDKKVFSYLKKFYSGLRYNPRGRVAYYNPQTRSSSSRGKICLVCAGTSDLPVAEEAAATLEAMGERMVKFYDVGVAGVHRVLGKVNLLRQCSVVIVIAGMEGALASIVSGLVSCPVVAVPTSVGYGANFSGLAPLLTILNSCSPGIAVVNIDNGFGAAYFASLINRG
ncbi:MAG: nickel pincer cofactor biosynthesis protein LarB [Candidatus Omnitrophica bacterium]|nr:nickel pincer cofactor biosynthesis protein LarB [Candidatus Omnitrophota bacterium]MBU1871397.1 nickel pincer cofactor biosynthesis protein LarB [Candidatus Omnitrophota bacterium]